jgi:mevalonate kinase
MSDALIFSKAFATTTTGKWILAGEHAVLRGSPALVFPLAAASLDFKFSPASAGDITLNLRGPHGSELELLFWGVLEKACAMTGLHRHQLAGEVSIESRIPVGAGLGASAAFCVAVARWFSHEGSIADSEIENFARELENLFHGESSGVDIAVAHGGKPIKFYRSGKPEVLELAWTPECYLTYSGQRGVTRECVNKVKELGLHDPEHGRGIDAQMKAAVLDAENALKLPKSDGLPLLQLALQRAGECFELWGLIDRGSEKKIIDLKKRGALAAKPTGSGGGGYLLSLWDAAPKPADDLISCFKE